MRKLSIAKRGNPLVDFQALRHWLLIGLVRSVGVWIIDGWMRTLRIEAEWAIPATNPLVCRETGQYIYAIWHEDQLVTGWKYGSGRLWAIISQSLDGEYVARIMGAFGWRVIRGSSSRGGVSALKRALELANAPDPFKLALTMDGPRGPRHKVKEGVAYLAAKTGLPIIPIACGYDRPWRARSWDRFVLPRPFRRVVVLAGAPIPAPTTSDRADLASVCDQLEAQMQRLAQEAELRATSPSGTGQPAGERRAA